MQEGHYEISSDDSKDNTDLYLPIIGLVCRRHSFEEEDVENSGFKTQMLNTRVRIRVDLQIQHDETIM